MAKRKIGIPQIKRKIDRRQLKKILALHEKFLRGKNGGNRADLSGLDLSGLDLSRADLSDADLIHTDLSDANLHHTNLTGANLTGACLARADLSRANLSDADLFDADLFDADLSYANLTEANLSGASGLGAVSTNEMTAGFHMVPPETGAYTAWKKVPGYLVKLLIPEDALRSSATTRKCRASKATVLGIYTLNGNKSTQSSVCSGYDLDVVYRVGETVKVLNFDTDRWNECAPGIHHFLTMDEAVRY